MTSTQKKLLRFFEDLEENQQEMLLAFAEFLHSRSQIKVPQTPQPIPRPPQESVIRAIKRLSATYPMLNESRLLHETSARMTAHLLEGQSAESVIDELEVFFRNEFEQWSSGKSK
ncbi:Crp/Fnr family transcriptional regulator [Gammaproteobacteria bacterium]